MNENIMNISGNLYIDILLSCLHNQQYQTFINFLKSFLRYNCFIKQPLLKITEKVKDHLLCFDNTRHIVTTYFDNWMFLDFIKIKEIGYIGEAKTIREWLILFFINNSFGIDI